MTEQMPVRKNTWKQDPEAVKADILRVATAEFADRGLSGARIDEIAAKTSVSKRMIYYYFQDKEGLYRAVLEGVYARLRANENALDLAGLDPVAALEELTRATFDSHRSLPDFIRLVMIENIHHAAYMKQSSIIPRLNSKIIETLTALCARGKAAGLFHADIDPVELHWMISAMSFYNVSNRDTFSHSFGTDMHSPEGQARLKQRVVEAVLSMTVIGHRRFSAP
ncbi:MAG: TetR/AcrR family transcriptional regulator [Cypionkella sp.]|jgi:AcrR family transcriptional regulator